MSDQDTKRNYVSSWMVQHIEWADGSPSHARAFNFHLPEGSVEEFHAKVLKLIEDMGGKEVRYGPNEPDKTVN